jgi:hypothetical protein
MVCASRSNADVPVNKLIKNEPKVTAAKEWLEQTDELVVF